MLMDIATSIKYLDYVSQECERLLRDGQVTDEELLHLIVEFERFQNQIRESELPDELKSKVSAIKLNYTFKEVERGKWSMALGFLTLGAWAIIIHMRKQSNRKQTLNDLKFDTSRLSSFVTLNY